MHVPLPEPVAVSEGLADTPGARLWYTDSGGDGEVVLLSHPASQSGRIWGYQLPVLAQTGYRVVAYSRRGVDRSERGPASDCGTTVGDLAALMDRLGIGRAHLVGAAAGGITALAFAVVHPGRVRSLVLAGTIFSPAEAEWREMYGRLGIAAVRDHVSTEFLELGPSYRARNPQGTELFAELGRQAKSQAPLGQPSGVTVIWGSMQRLNLRVLLVTGEADLYAPPPLQNLIARHLPNRELATLREVGHAAYWEAPEAFNGLLLDFLDRQRGG